MNISTKFSPGDIVFAANKYYDMASKIESEAYYVVPYYYVKEGPFEVVRVEIDVETNKRTINYILKEKGTLPLPHKYQEEWLHFEESTAMNIVDSNNKVCRQMRADLEAKCR